jgi:hypothetical protein
MRQKSPRQLDREIAEALARTRASSAISHVDRHGHRYADRLHSERRNAGRWKGTEVQSLLFSRPQWSEGKAKDWAEEHGYRHGKVDVTDNYVRLRQFAPIRGTQKRTIMFGDGIKAVIEQVK